MRIYTEVNFEWNDKQGKLVETSSKSFDYQGELALCGYSAEAQYFWRDEGGNEWVLQLDIELVGNEATAERYLKNGAVVSDWDANLQDGNSAVTRIRKFEFFMDDHGVKLKFGGGKEDPDGAEDAWKEWYTENTHMQPTDDLITNAEVAARALSDEWTYATDAAGEAEWREISTLPELGWEEVKPGFWEQSARTETGLVEGGKDIVFDIKKLSGEETRRATELALMEKIKQWEEIITPGGYDVVESEIRGYISNLKEKEEDIKTAFEDIFGAEGEEEGTIWEVMEQWETAKERGKQKYITDIGFAGIEKEEGLEETVVGREGELEALREEAGGEIRAAEAKIGAAGFASTGVGQTARDILAEEIGEAARDIDVGFTEERSDVKQSYLTKVDPLEKEFGEEGTAYEDYITTRDIAAKGALDPWKTATEAYQTEKTRYEEIYRPGVTDPIAGSAAVALGDIGSQMMELITSQISGTDLTDPDPDWEPFAEGAFLEKFDPSTYGLMGETYFFTGVPETTWDEPFYEPYEADEELQLYDPDKLLPWEDITSGDPFTSKV